MYCLQVVPETLQNPIFFFRLKACTGLDPKNDGRPQASFDRMQSFFVAIWKIIPTVLWEFEVFSLGEFSHFPHEENIGKP